MYTKNPINPIYSIYSINSITQIYSKNPKNPKPNCSFDLIDIFIYSFYSTVINWFQSVI
jgi:hypothetical protein